MREIMRACSQQSGVPVENMRVKLVRSGDLEHHCRRLLLQRSPGDMLQLHPGCVFGDIMVRCAPDDLLRVNELLEQHLGTVNALISKKARKREIVKQGRRFFKKAARIMLRAGRIDPGTLVAHCYTAAHDGFDCKVLPQRTAGQADES